MNDEILVVVKEEHHHWKTCPCEVCLRTREYRKPTNSRHINIKPKAAHILGIIPRLSPDGSLARALAKQQKDDS